MSYVRAHPLPVAQWKMQFCTLLQVPVRLYGDSINLKSFTSPVLMLYATKYSSTVTKNLAKHFAERNYVSSKAPILRIYDLLV
jgi:hypothetical protein